MIKWLKFLHIIPKSEIIDMDILHIKENVDSTEQI